MVEPAISGLNLTGSAVLQISLKIYQCHELIYNYDLHIHYTTTTLPLVPLHNFVNDPSTTSGRLILAEILSLPNFFTRF